MSSDNLYTGQGVVLGRPSFRLDDLCLSVRQVVRSEGWVFLCFVRPLQ